jgi:hypothetical protein
VRNELAVALKMSCDFHGAKIGILGLITNKLLRVIRQELGSVEAHDEFSMFIDNVHILNNPKEGARRDGGMIRLKIANHILNEFAGNTLYFSFVSGNTLWLNWPRFEYRETNDGAMLCPVGRIGDKADNVVKGRSKVMDNFAREDAETEAGFSFVGGTPLPSA